MIKTIDVVLWIEPRTAAMEGADKFTELWQPPTELFLKLCSYFFKYASCCSCWSPIFLTEKPFSISGIWTLGGSNSNVSCLWSRDLDHSAREEASFYLWPPTYFVWINVLCLCWISSSFTLFGQIQTCQTGGRSHNDSSPYGDCSLTWLLSQPF